MNLFHSLYFWLLLRTGSIGFVVAMLGFAFYLLRALAIYARSDDGQIKSLALCIFALILIFLFSGMFNPVYGEARYMAPLGVALGVMTALGRFHRLQRKAAVP